MGGLPAKSSLKRPALQHSWSPFITRIPYHLSTAFFAKDQSMPAAIQFGFVPYARPRGVLIMFCDENLQLGPASLRALAPIGDLFRRAAAADRFTGKMGSSLDIVAPTGLNLPRLVVIGLGKESELKPRDIVRLGGIAMGKV